MDDNNDNNNNNNNENENIGNTENNNSESLNSENSDSENSNSENSENSDSENHGDLANQDNQNKSKNINSPNSIELQKTMRSSYLDYAMSVIVGRALPDVKDGLKPVHRRVIYAMFDGGYRPEKGFFKCTRVIGEVMGKYHPHGDTAIYDALTRLAQDWSLRYTLVAGQGNFGSPGDDNPAAPRYTECKMNKLAMQMVRDIDQNTVDFVDNYDGRQKEPVILPARFPNLLVNGSEGIAVGMATKIPPHNLNEVSNAVMWHLDNYDATDEELLENSMKIIQGPDFPTSAYIVGKKGIEDAYRTGRGSVILRAVCEIEDTGKKQQIVIKELPYQVNPDVLARQIEGLAADNVIKGISAVTDYSSGRTGQRLVVKLKKDAISKVVLNNLYKHTRLQDSFPCNMVALVNGVPKRLKLNEFISNWTLHQIDIIVRRTKYRLNEAQKRAHILSALLKALDMIDEVISLIRKSPSADDAREGLKELLKIDNDQANAILELQLRRLAALERQKIIDEAKAIEEAIKGYNKIIESPVLQRSIVKDELTKIVEKYGDERRTKIIPDDSSIESEGDFINEEDVVITITKSGLIKSTPLSSYRAQKRGGKGLKGGNIKDGDIVEHFFITSTHHWLLFWTSKGRVYRLKAYQVPRTDRVSRGKHINNLLTLLPDESVAQILNLKNYTDNKYIILATKNGLVKKSDLKLYDVNRTSGIIGITLSENDELVSAKIADDDAHILVVSQKGSAIHFIASENTLRSTGRSSKGNIGIRFRDDDKLLSMDIVSNSENSYVFTMTENGFAKRTKIQDYTIHSRGGKGMKVAKETEKSGNFVGALIVNETDEIMIIMDSGKVLRSQVSEIRPTSRATVGVRFAKPDENQKVIGVAKNTENIEDIDE